MEVYIREAVLNDTKMLALLMSQLGYPTTSMEMISRLEKIIAHQDYKTYVATSGLEVVGMIGSVRELSYESNSIHVRIMALVVDEKNRQMGIAKKLCAQVEFWAKSMQAKSLFVNAGNKPERKQAHIFYPQMGFIHRSSGYYKPI